MPPDSPSSPGPLAAWGEAGTGPSRLLLVLGPCLWEKRPQLRVLRFCCLPCWAGWGNRQASAGAVMFAGKMNPSLGASPVTCAQCEGSPGSPPGKGEVTDAGGFPPVLPGLQARCLAAGGWTQLRGCCLSQNIAGLWFPASGAAPAFCLGQNPHAIGLTVSPRPGLRSCCTGRVPGDARFAVPIQPLATLAGQGAVKAYIWILLPHDSVHRGLSESVDPSRQVAGA